MMISGIEIEVQRPTGATSDRFGNEVHSYSSETVGNVLVSPGSTDDLEASRPEGVTVALTLHFPKGYDKCLAGSRVVLPAPWAGTYRVVGDPRPYIDADTPTPWHMPVEVERADG